MDPSTATEIVAEATEALAETVTMVTIAPDQYLVLVDYLNWISGFSLFFVIVALCYFGYKFFRIFF